MKGILTVIALICNTTLLLAAVTMQIKNIAGSPIEVFWVSSKAQNPEFVKQTDKPIRNATYITIHSFEGHEFIVKSYGKEIIKEAGFVKGPTEETIIVQLDQNTKKFHIKKTTKHDEIRSNIRSAMALCAMKSLSKEEVTNCIADKVSENVQKVSDLKDEMERYRDAMGYKLRNYTCADPEMTTSKPIRTRNLKIGGRVYALQTLFDTSHAKISAIENFITEEECGHFIKYGAPRLHRATVAAADGSSTVSVNRKAQQASYDIQTRPDDPLWNIYHRALHVTNSYTGFNLQPDGQEDFTIIQYGVGDQYTPHCDGSCDGQPHNSGGRIATVVLYCKVPEVGGGTSFTKADVFVKPSVGQATFFSYRGPDGLMDSGYTEHSGCPVLKGEKWITTFWMRDGVSKANPWTIYDPTGIPILQSNIADIETGAM